MNSEANELPKGLVLGRDGNIHIRLIGSSPLDDVGCYTKGMGSLAKPHNGQPNLVSNSPFMRFKPKTSHFQVKMNTTRP